MKSDHHPIYFVLENVPGFSHTLVILLAIVLQSFLHTGLDDVIDLAPQHISGNSGTKFDQEDESQQHSEGHSHAVVLPHGSAAAEEGHSEDDASDHDEKDRGVEELIAQEVQVLAVHALDDSSGDDQRQTRNLEDEKDGRRKETKEENTIL